MFGLFRRKDSEKYRNDKVRAALAKYGDDGTRVRHVLHFVFPDTNGDANEADILEFLRAQQLTVDPEKSKSGFIAEEYREVASGGFDAWTAALTRAMQERNWKYDGWECAVETGD